VLKCSVCSADGCATDIDRSGRRGVWAGAPDGVSVAKSNYKCTGLAASYLWAASVNGVCNI
jgi:hypothetical protein